MRIRYDLAVPNLRIRQAAELLGVSDDTVRRWINQGTLAVSLDAAGRKGYVATTAGGGCILGVALTAGLFLRPI